jgi:glyoxylate reductase
VGRVLISRKVPDKLLAPYQSWDIEMWPHEEKEMDRAFLLEQAKKSSALLTVLSDKINQEVLDACQNVKVIANMAVGYDNIDVEYAKKKGIVVTNTPDILTETTADLTFALLLATARKIVEASEYLQSGKWENWSPYLMAGTDVHHKTIGIVGMGRIGESVAKRATGFNMNILYHNRTRKPETEEKLGAKYTSFEELITTSDYVVCLTPLTPDTKEMFNAETFKKMKKSATFINVSRGGTVNEDALYEALKNGEIAQAGLDVFQKEPIDPHHPLLTLDNVTALPHIGSASVETRTQMIELCLENIDLVLKGKTAKTEVK